MGLDINLNKKQNINIFDRARLRLTSYYILVVMVIIGLFSLVLYNIIINEVRGKIIDNIDEELFQEEIIKSTSVNIKTDILFIDLILLFLVAYLSYVLSGKTLKPIADSLEAQKKFSAEASHDLRTPLAIMQTDIEVTLGSNSRDIEVYKKTLESNLEEVKKMSILTEDLLFVARMENSSRNKDLAEVELDSFVKKLISKMEKNANNKNISISYINESVDTKIKIIPNYFERALQNVIQNAINYTKTGGKIEIKVSQNENQFLFRVSDTGVGIKEEELPKVFSRFYKGSNSKNMSSFGLGLPIAKRIVEDHKGKISVKSKEGEGTLVAISIPIK